MDRRIKLFQRICCAVTAFVLIASQTAVQTLVYADDNGTVNEATNEITETTKTTETTETTETTTETTSKSGDRWIDSLKFPDRNVSVGDEVTDNDIAIYIGGKQVEFINKPYIEENQIMLPAKELIENLGFFIGYRESLPIPGKAAGYFGRVNTGDVSIVPGSDVAYYDDVPLELPAATVETADDVYVPLYFIQFIYGLKLSQNGGAVYLTLDIIEEESSDDDEVDIEEKVKDLEGTNLVSWDKMLENGNSGNPGDAVVSRVVELEDDQFDKVIEIENNTRPAASYYNQKNFSSEIPVSIGDIVVVTGWVRYTRCVDESGSATTHFCIESEGDWDKAMYTPDLSVGKNWQKFTYACQIPFNRDAGKVGFKIRVGYNYQTLQYADIKVVNYGTQIKYRELDPSVDAVAPLTYRGQEDDALWREEALRRIDKYRKSPIKVNVKNEDGTPVSNADINLTMTRNEFIFGTAAEPYWNRNKYPYHEELVKYFNGYVNEANFKEFQNRTNAARMANLAREYNMYIRGHLLFYDARSSYPTKNLSADDVKNFTYDEAYNLVVPEMAGRIALLGDYLQEVELTNEMPDYRILRDRYGWQFTADILEAGSELLGDGRIKMINTTGVAGQQGGISANGAIENNINCIEIISQDYGIEFNSLGVQGHGGASNSPVDYYIQFDHMAQGIEYLANTEYDYVSDLERGSKEALHKEACHLRDYVMLFYSHPKATGFLMWGFTDKEHWRYKGPLTDRSYVPKDEAVKYWTELTQDEWMPKIDAKTDENGEYSVRTHRGEFDVTVKVGEKEAKTTLKSTKDGLNEVNAVVTKDGIEIESSEPVLTLKDTTEELNLTKVRLNDKNYDATYESLSENKVKSIKTQSGEDVTWLADSDNKTPWISKDNDEYLTVELSETRRKGYVTLKWQEGGKYIFQVEVSEDGENWEKVSGSESEDRNVIKFFYPETAPKNIRYIRLSSASGKMIAPTSVCVYPVQYYALRK